MKSETQDTSVPPSIARRLVRSLTRGTAVADGVRYIHVGHDRWLAAQAELLDEIGEDGHSDTKFVRGAYGAGKSHFLSVVQDAARGAGWMTSHVECKVDHVEIDRFETLYPRVVAKLSSEDLLKEQANDAGAIDPMRHLLDRWCERLYVEARVKPDAVVRPFDAENRVYAALQKGLLRSNLPPQFIKALTAFVRASLVADDDVLTAICAWLRGEPETMSIPDRYLGHPNPVSPSGKATSFDLRPIGKGTATDVMRGLLWLVRTSGYIGLVLCIDEVEELAKFHQKRRQDQALQALREFVDNSGSDLGYRHLCIFLAATPDMFESEQYFPRYDALATRIQPIGKEINWRAPVIDLDRTPLSTEEMRQMARRIREVHRAAYGGKSSEAINESIIDSFVNSVVESRFRVAKPRLLARMLIDELERARQSGEEYRLPADPRSVTSEVASALDDESRA